MWSQSIEVINPYEALAGENKKKSQTNADRIRAMSDEELAWLLAFIQTDLAEVMLKAIGCSYIVDETTKQGQKDFFRGWLKQPAEGNDG